VYHNDSFTLFVHAVAESSCDGVTHLASGCLKYTERSMRCTRLLPRHRFTEFPVIGTNAITSSDENNGDPDGNDTDHLHYAHQYFAPGYAVNQEKGAGD
jgi:hypothetical protein